MTMLTAPVDWDRERAATSSSADFLHLNHASTSLQSASTYQAMRDYLQLEESVGAHRAVARLRDELDDAAAAVALLLGVKAHQVAFVEGASRGWAQALSSVPWTSGIDVFVSEQEWAANIINTNGLPHARLRTIELPDSGNWLDSLGDLKECTSDQRVPVVSLPVVDCVGDPQNQWTDVSHRVREVGGWLFIDASQAVGQMPVNAAEIGADVLVFPARKWLRGPRGIAAMVLSDRALTKFGNPSTMDIYGTELSDGLLGLRHGSGARRFQPYDCPAVLKLGMRQAVLDLLRVGPQRVRDRIESLASSLRDALRDLSPQVEVLPGTSGIVSIRISRQDHAEIARALWAAQVNVAVVGERYAPLGMEPGESVLRLSVHSINMETDIQKAIEHIRAALAHCS
jgi:cysteine desulfurase / selenocysteine lyase